MVMVSSPMFAAMYNIVEIIDYMEWEKTSPQGEKEGRVPVFFGDEFWKKQRGEWPLSLNFNIATTILATVLFIFITIEKQYTYKQRL